MSDSIISLRSTLRMDAVLRKLRRIQQIPLKDLFRVTPWVMFGSGFTIVLVILAFAMFRRTGHRTLFALDIAALLIVLGLTLLLLLRHFRDSLLRNLEIHNEMLRVLLLSFHCGILLLIIPASLLAWVSDYYLLQWNYFGFTDKRYLLLLYWIGISTVFILPFLFRRILFSESLLRLDEPAPAAAKGRIMIKIVLGLMIGWYFTGFPWNMQSGDPAVNIHEFFHLGPLQAIHKGYVPYLGPASIQYGPGSQLFSYLYMHLTGQFSLLGLREATAALHFFSFTLFCVAAMLLLPVRASLLAILLSLGFSPFSFFYWENGSLWGFWGWANPVRYLGGSLLILALPEVYKCKSEKWRAVSAFLLGVGWGLFCYMSQENFFTGITGIMLLTSILYAVKHISGGQVRGVLTGLAGGFLLFWLAPFLYYAFHGGFLKFLSNYLLIPRLVAAGYSNLPFEGGVFSRYGIPYMITPLLLMTGGFFLFFDLPRLRMRMQLERRHIRFLAILIVVMVCFPASLLRSDPTHFQNVLIGFPLFVAAFVADVPRFFSAQRKRRWLLPSVILMFVLFIYPYSRRWIFNPYSWIVKEPAKRLMLRDDSAMAARYFSTWRRRTHSMQDVTKELSDLKTEIDNRKVFVERFPEVPRGAIYFLGDFYPAPYLYDLDTLEVNNVLLARNLEHMQAHMDQFEIVITLNLKSPYSRLFLQLRPDAEILTRTFAGSDYYVMGQELKDKP